MAKTKSDKSLTASQAIVDIERLAKKAGLEGSVVRAQHFHNPFDLRRPSGVPSIDIATGGGLPAGGLSQIGGQDSTGKNYMLYRYIANVQKIYKKQAAIAIACFEPTTDKRFARACGVQLAHDNYEIELIQKERKKHGDEPLSASEIKALKKQLGEFVILRGFSELTLQNVLYLLETNQFQIIGIDSWDALLPPDDRAKELKDRKKMVDGPALESRFMRKFWSILNKKSHDGRENETTVIGIRQVRANMSMYGPNLISVGSNAIKHGKLVDLTLRPGAKITDKEGNVIGKRLSWKIAKGKAGCHEGPKGEVDYYHDPPRVDVLADLIETAQRFGVIQRTASWYTYGDVKKQGVEALKNAILHQNRKDELMRDVKQASGLNYRWK